MTDEELASGTGQQVDQHMMESSSRLACSILTSLGWEVMDAPQTLKYEGIRHKVLLPVKNGGLAAIVLKPWGDRLDLNRSIHKDYPSYVAVTDGRRWALYETHNMVDPDKALMVSFDASNPSEFAEAARFLKPAILKDMSLGPYSVSTMLAEADRFDPYCDYVERPQMLFVPMAGCGPVPAWQQIPVRYWKDLCVEVVRWLVNNGKLTLANCTIPRLHSSIRYITHSAPFHPDASEFSEAELESVRVGNGSIFIDTKFSRRAHLKNIATILKHVREDPWRYGML